MTLTLQLPAELEARLLQEAEADGTEPEQWATAALAERLLDEDAAEEAWAIREHDKAQAELAAGARIYPADEVFAELRQRRGL